MKMLCLGLDTFLIAKFLKPLTKPFLPAYKLYSHIIIYCLYIMHRLVVVIFNVQYDIKIVYGK